MYHLKPRSCPQTYIVGGAREQEAHACFRHPRLENEDEAFGFSALLCCNGVSSVCVLRPLPRLRGYNWGQSTGSSPSIGIVDLTISPTSVSSTPPMSQGMSPVFKVFERGSRLLQRSYLLLENMSMDTGTFNLNASLKIAECRLRTRSVKFAASYFMNPYSLLVSVDRGKRRISLQILVQVSRTETGHGTNNSPQKA